MECVTPAGELGLESDDATIFGQQNDVCFAALIVELAIYIARAPAFIAAKQIDKLLYE